MSKENVKKLFDEIKDDLDLQKKYAGLIQKYNQATEKIFFDMLIEFGKTSGFTFSKEDLIAANAEYTDKANSNKELSSGDLEKVAGGFPYHWASAQNSSQVFFLFRCI